MPRPGFSVGWTSATLLLLLFTTGLVFATFHDYGVTWDEDVHNWYGEFVLNYYLSGFRDTRALTWLNLYNYGAAFDMTAAAINRVSSFGTYETRHLLNGLIGILGLIGTAKLGRLMAGPRAGFLSALLLIAIPNYYGQMFNNPKDIPFAVASIWSVYYMCRIVPELPRPAISLVIKLGFAIGMALGVRVGGLLLLGYVGLAGLAYCVWLGLETGSWLKPVRAGLTAGATVLAPMLLIAYPVMLLFWPWAQQDPIGHPLKTLEFFSHVTFPFYTLFAGRYYPASDLPWSYLPTHIVLALPELVLLPALLALPLSLVALYRTGRVTRRTRALHYLVIATAILFPVVYAVTIRAVLFDGMRHFIFVLPPLAVAAALVVDALLERAAAFRHKRVMAGLVAFCAVQHIGVMIALHPDEYVYYNNFVGGVKGAETLFKTDYWGNSYAEAVHGLQMYLETEYGAGFEDHDFSIAVCGPPISADYFFPTNFIFTEDRAHADFFIAFTKDDCDKSLSGKEVYRVERLGALLSVVLDRRSIEMLEEEDAIQAATTRPSGSATP